MQAVFARRVLLALALALAPGVPGSAAAASSADEAFARLAADFLEDLPVLSPVGATAVGDHRHDHLLDEVDAAARERQLRLYRRYLERLAAIERDTLSRASQVDAELLRAHAEAGIWNIETLQEWAWNPLYYVNLAGSSVYALMARDFAPLAERLESAAARLEQFPRFFRQARSQLDPARVPRIHAETAAQQNRGVLSIVDAMVQPEAESAPPELRARLEDAIAAAREAVEEHQRWLEERLLPAARGEFRIGEALFEAKLRHTLHSPLKRREIRRRAEAEYERVRQEMYRLAKEVYRRKHPYTSFPDAADEAYKQAVTRAALEEAYRRLPERDAIVDVARDTLLQATDFVRASGLVSVPDDPIEIIVMPEFQRGVAVAYLDPPGPLDEGQKSFYAVAPLPEEWSEEQVQSFLREYNMYSIHNLTLHEAMPGHYLQLALSNRYPSTLRAALWSGPFVEGWAVYAERVMMDVGYLEGDPLMRLINLKWYLRTVTNAIIDQAIHVDGMSREAAMRLMIEGAFQEEREAAGKWVRAQLTSTQLSTYFVGYQEHADMRTAAETAWGSDFSLRRYHDRALSYGSPPVQYVRALLLNEPIPQAPLP